MSEPKRYGIDPKYCSIEEFEDGQYVSYEDYARLKEKAEQYRLASLRVDVGELHAQFNRALFDETVAENARLKTEVERLEARIEYVDNLANRYALDDVRSQAQVERLTKAGDNMYSWLGVCGRHNNSTGDDWLRAKKGLPSLTEQWEIEKRNRAAEDAAKEGHNMWGIVAPYVVPPCIDRYTAKEGKQP